MNARRAAAMLAIAGLFGAGAAHWFLFFGPARSPWRGPSFTVEDWPILHVVWWGWRGCLSRAAQARLIAAAVVSPWLLYNASRFGSILPVRGRASMNPVRPSASGALVLQPPLPRRNLVSAVRALFQHPVLYPLSRPVHRLSRRLGLSHLAVLAAIALALGIGLRRRAVAATPEGFVAVFAIRLSRGPGSRIRLAFRLGPLVHAPLPVPAARGDAARNGEADLAGWWRAEDGGLAGSARGRLGGRPRCVESSPHAAGKRGLSRSGHAPSVPLQRFEPSGT